jgi:hypothetical protein
MLSFVKKTFSLLKKIALVIGVYVVVISLFFMFWNRSQGKSNVNLAVKSRNLTYSFIGDKQLNSTKEGKKITKIYRIFICLTTGEACTDNPQDGDKNFESSLFGHVSKLLAFPYTNPPASGLYWAQSVLENANFIPKSYAVEGVGFSSIKIVKDIWLAFRNISFLALVLVFIAIGFMVMFRMKINPQTVISVENALPKIIITMILITFSYAIAGFMIDLMYVVTIFLIDALASTGGYITSDKFSSLANGSILGLDFFGNFSLYWKGLNGIYALFSPTIKTILHLVNVVIIVILMAKLGTGIGSLLNKLFKTQANIMPAGLGITIDIISIVTTVIGITSGGTLAPSLFMLIFLVIIILGLLTLMFRIFFLLLYSYIQLLIYIIFAPFFILIEAVPGQKGFSSWFKNILGNLIVFPVVIVLFIIVEIINNNISASPSLFLPPLLGGLTPESFISIIDLSFLIMIPDLAKSLKQMIIGKETTQIQPANILGSSGSALQSGLGLLSTFSTVNLGMAAIKQGFGFFSKKKDEK